MATGHPDYIFKRPDFRDDETVVVTFRRPHRHRGCNYVPGDRARVTPKAAQKLLTQYEVIQEKIEDYVSPKDASE